MSHKIEDLIEQRVARSKQKRLDESVNIEVAESLDFIFENLECLHEASNAQVEVVINKLRKEYLANRTMTFRQFLSVFASILS